MSCSVTVCVSAETKRVVDEHDPVDLSRDEQLGRPMGDRLRIRVPRRIGEPDERAVDRLAAKLSVERPFFPTASQRTSRPSA